MVLNALLAGGSQHQSESFPAQARVRRHIVEVERRIDHRVVERAEAIVLAFVTGVDLSDPATQTMPRRVAPEIVA